MEKRLIDRFTQDFEQCLSPDQSMVEIFERAKSKFESECGFTPYSNYRSYSTARRSDRKKCRRQK